MHLLSTQNRSTFIYSALVYLTKQRNLKHGKALHAKIIVAPSSSTHILNNLLNLYAKCGDLHSARQVFDGISNKDVVSWNCLINGYSQQGGLGGLCVMELFRRMRAENEFPNGFTFGGVFSAAASMEDEFFGRQVHGVVVKSASFEDVYVGSSVLNMYCKVGDLAEARKVFDRMPVRNSVSWATLISGYATLRMVKEVVCLFEVMRRDEDEDGDVNEFVVTGVLSALSAAEFVHCGKQVHGVVVKNGLISFLSVGNALVTMYAKCGNLDDALKTFELCGDKNSITWSAMVTGYAQNGDCSKALDLFSEMHSSRLKPSEYTLVGALNACSDVGAAEEGMQVHAYLLKSGFESQMYIMTALVDMYAKSGQLDNARKGFDYLKQPDIVLWTSMITGYVQNGENEEALVLYGRMRNKGIVPNELTMASVLKACSSLAALEQGRQVHACTIKYGLGLAVPIGSALSTMYSKCGSLEDGNMVFSRMPGRDVVSWNAMISGIAQNGRGDEALELFEQMRQEGTKPDYVTFVNILSACSHMGLVERGWAYFKMMSTEFGIEQRVEHYACMVDILSRAGKLNEAKEFIESANIDHGLCLWRILLSACRNYRNYELGAYAGEKLMELGSQESSAYVLLSSIYTSLGQPKDVERVRSLMKLRGVSKEPGCSWIELQSRVHVFVVGDQLHPQISEIRPELRRLSKLMRDEGYRPSLESASAASSLI